MSESSDYNTILKDAVRSSSFVRVPGDIRERVFLDSKGDNPDPELLSFLEKCILHYKAELLSKPIICDAKIVEQPTWGGTAILKKKGLIDKPEWVGKKAGQAYENHAHLPVKTDDGWSFTVLDVSLVLGEAFLGKVAYRIVPAMGQLRKYTEAFGNSFQMHLDHPERIERDGRKELLIPKGEAMRYLDQPGLLTCGVRCNGDADWQDYEKRLRRIESEMKELSQQVLSGKMDLDTAKKEATEVVHRNNPYRWVNLLRPEPDDVVDFSVPKRHHSWEEVNELTRKLFNDASHELQKYDDIRINKLDEIQTGLYVDLDGKYLDTPSVTIDEFSRKSLTEKRKSVLVLTDDNSSIRGFDKGKFRNDGSLRSLDLDSYFKFIAREKKMNSPQSAIVKPRAFNSSEGLILKYIFATNQYAFTVIETSKKNDEQIYAKSFSEKFCNTHDSYHHIYVDAGPALISFEDDFDPVTVEEGYSVFLNAQLGKYGVNPAKSCERVRVSITYVPGDE
ncbi:MAG: hypothetical protein HN337_05255 [Deltaproteobacteria bacterium]|jgi:hypothetical protein|nr:hypothetical protein [Deltaproteobacteria bacterium]